MDRNTGKFQKEAYGGSRDRVSFPAPESLIIQLRQEMAYQGRGLSRIVSDILKQEIGNLTYLSRGFHGEAEAARAESNKFLNCSIPPEINAELKNIAKYHGISRPKAFLGVMRIYFKSSAQTRPSSCIPFLQRTLWAERLGPVMENITVRRPPEKGGVIEFRAEAEELTAAVKRTGIDISRVRDNRARALFLMRCFYVLGMQRGGEVARASLLDEEPEVGRFSLSGACSRMFLDELAGLSSLTLEALCKGIGL